MAVETKGNNRVAEQTVDNVINRAPNYTPVYIFEVRPYVNAKTGKQMFSFNNGSLHLSYKQLYAAGVEVPELLQEKTIMVDFFQIGEALLNGDIVRDENRIVRGFVAPQDREVLVKVATDMKAARQQGWLEKMQSMSTTRTTQSAQADETDEQDTTIQAKNAGIGSPATPETAGK